MSGGGIEHYYKGNVFEGRGQTQHRFIHLQFTSSQFEMFTWMDIPMLALYNLNCENGLQY